MADTVTLVSTTDSAEDVQAALTGKPAEPKAETPPAGEKPAGETPPPPAADAKPAETPAGETKPPVETKPDDQQPPASETPEQKTARERRMEKIQGEIDVLWKKKHELRRDVEAEESRLEALRKELTNLAAKGTTTTPPADKPVEAAKPAEIKVEPSRPQPLLADTKPDGTPKYANYEEWVADLATWQGEMAEKRAEARLELRLKAERDERDKKDADERARIERESANRAANEGLAKHQTVIEEFKKTHADYDAVIDGAVDAVVEMKGDYVAAAKAAGQQVDGQVLFAVLDRFTVEDSVNGAALMYYLAKHTDEMKKIVQLPIAQQLIALARLDSRLEGASSQPGPSTKVTPTTKAPEPIKPVGGGPTAPATVSPDNESYAEYKARRDREDRARLGLPVA
jgi:peptidoglycan hydrolase CwlO-like protein